MKVLISDVTDSYVFPGGKQVHAHKLLNHLRQIGVDVEFENWYDPNLNPDVIHFLGYDNLHKLRKLKSEGCKLVLTHIMDHLTSQPNSKLQKQVWKNEIFRRLPDRFFPMFPWKGLAEFDKLVYMHEEDRRAAIRLYKVNPEKAVVIPHAVDSFELYQKEVAAEDYLVSIATIMPRKNNLITAKICNELKIPILFMGPAWEKNSEYFRDFMNEMEKGYCTYLGFIEENKKIEILNKAKGFVLLSEAESGCIAVHEAAAAGLPLLLSDLAWSKSYPEPKNLLFTSIDDPESMRSAFLNFYKNSKRIDQPSFKMQTWKDVAMQYQSLYKKIL